MAGKQRLEMLIPFVHEIESAFLHPAIEIASRDRIRIMKYSILRSQNLHRSLFHRNPGPAQFRRIRRKVSAIKISHTSVVLHDERSARCHKIEQFLVIRDYIFLRIVGAYPQYNRSVPPQFRARQGLRRN